MYILHLAPIQIHTFTPHINLKQINDGDEFYAPFYYRATAMLSAV